MCLKYGYLDGRYIAQLKVLSVSSGGVALGNVGNLVAYSDGLPIPVTNNILLMQQESWLKELVGN